MKMISVILIALGMFLAPCYHSWENRRIAMLPNGTAFAAWQRCEFCGCWRENDYDFEKKMVVFGPILPAWRVQVTICGPEVLEIPE